MLSSSPRIRILIVDDHPVVRDGLASMIENQEDMEVVGEGETGQAAVCLYEQLLPDVMLLDLKLPDIDGVQVLERLRPSHPNARVIVLTTYVGDVQARRALRAGACGYLLKASLRRDLRDTIRSVHAGGRRIQEEVAADLAQHTVDDTLTAREIEILKLIAGGHSNKLAADRLQIREDTVKAHVTNILAKLNASDRTHAVTIALQRGYFEL